MKLRCKKCGEPIGYEEACTWEEWPPTYLCPDCYAVEENFEVEEDDENYEKVKHLL